MNRAKVLQEVRLMKFEEIYSRRQARQLTQEQAAEILGVSARTLRRREDRYEAEGAEGLFDRRLGKLANNRVPADTTMEVLELFDTQYRDYTPKHFHEKLEADHSFKHSYNWLRLTLQRHGRIQPASRRGAHRRKRMRSPHWFGGADMTAQQNPALPDDFTNELARLSRAGFPLLPLGGEGRKGQFAGCRVAKAGRQASRGIAKTDFHTE